MSRPFCTNLPAISRASELSLCVAGAARSTRVPTCESPYTIYHVRLGSFIQHQMHSNCACAKPARSARPSITAPMKAILRISQMFRIRHTTTYCMIFKALLDMFGSCAGVRMLVSQNKSVSRLRRCFHAVRFTHLLQRDLICKASEVMDAQDTQSNPMRRAKLVYVHFVTHDIIFSRDRSLDLNRPSISPRPHPSGIAGCM